MAKIKRSLFATYLNTVPGGVAVYELIGAGVTTGVINYNPKTTEETYIHEDSATISIDSYAPTMPLEASAVAGDAVFEFVDTLRKARAVLADAETDVINIWNYETGGPTAVPAEKQPCSIQIDSWGGDGGAAVKINFTVNYLGAPVIGTFNITTKAFTAS